MYNRIRNCFRFVCPKNWDNLQPTDESSVRFCQSCNEKVYLVENDADFITHAKEGHCVAKAFPSDNELPELVLGRPSNVGFRNNPEDNELRNAILEDQHRLQEVAGLEEAKDEAIANIDVADPCPTCSFPIPSSWGECMICRAKRYMARRQ